MTNSPISQRAAGELLKNGNWLTESQLRRELTTSTFNLTRTWLPIGSMNRSQHERLSLRLQDTLEAASAVLIETTEHHIVTPDAIDTANHRYQQVFTRFRPYRVLKITPTIQAAKFSLVSLACTTIAILSMDMRESALLLGRSLNDLRNVVKALLVSWESITDPTEVTVLTLLCEHRALAVVDYDALHAGTYSAAYGLLSPSTDELVALADERYGSDGPSALKELSSKEARHNAVSEALLSLCARGVIREDNGRWIVVL